MVTQKQTQALRVLNGKADLTGDELRARHISMQTVMSLVGRKLVGQVYDTARIQRFRITEPGEAVLASALGLNGTQGATDYEPHPFEASDRFDVQGRQLCRLCPAFAGHRVHMRDGVWS